MSRHEHRGRPAPDEAAGEGGPQTRQASTLAPDRGSGRGHAPARGVLGGAASPSRRLASGEA